ncbi:MAG: serine/threonine protein kinase [Phycisphaeraceae bacterium]|nr:serine/threonine protein kinase [Phycisphaeraceae bacterium]
MSRRSLDIARRVARLQGADRAREVARACEGDDALRHEVEALLRADAGETIERSGGAESAPAESAVRDQSGDARYTLMSLLGEGGMGLVYLAEQASTGQRVALKFLRPGLVSRQAMRRFEREAKMLGRLQHRAIARAIDAGSMSLAPGAPAQPYIAMEFVEGVPITRYVELARPGLSDRLTMLAELAHAAHHAHTRGVIHRDLKPSNVLVTPEGRVKVLDFGVARAIEESDDGQGAQFTEAGSLIGTLAYMSPEQASGDAREADTRSDVFALGLIMLETLTGRGPEPLHTSTLAEALRRASERDVSADRGALAALPRDVRVIVRTATAREPSRRYQSAEQLASDIERYLRKEPISARPPSAVYHATRFAQRHTGAAAATLLVALSIVGGAALAGRQAVIATRERDKAVAAEESASAVNRLLVDMLTSADPERSLGRDLTVRDVLAQAESVIASNTGATERPGVEGSLRGAIGRSYYGLGMYDEADAQLTRAAELLSRVGPDAWKARNDSVRYLGLVATQRGDVESALALARESHAELQLRLGADHPDTIQAEAEIARAVYSSGSVDEGMTMFLDIAERAERALGVEDNIAMTLRHNYATALIDRGDFRGSAEQLAVVLERRSRTLGPEHPQTLYAKNNLATTLVRLGENERAERLLRETLEGRRRVLGESHPETANVAMNLGNLLATSGRAEEAEPLVRAALDAFGARFGDAHLRTATAINILAYLVEQRGELDEAERLYRRSLAAVEAMSGVLAADTLAPMNNLAMLLSDKGEHGQADAIFVELISRTTALAGAQHPFVAVFTSNRAMNLTRAGRADEAVALLEACIPALEAGFGPDHARSVTARERLAEAERARDGRSG